MDEDRYLTPREAARYLGVSRQSLYDYIKRHALPYYPLPGSRGRRFKKADLDALLKRRQGE
jgi:excisionase family DNA binding protein